MSIASLARAGKIFLVHNRSLQSRFYKISGGYPVNQWPSNQILLRRSVPVGDFLHSHFKRGYATYNSSIADKILRKTLIYLKSLVIAMVGSSYAAVPLYWKLCQTCGPGGTGQRKERVEDKIAWHTRQGTITQRLSLF